MATKLESDFPSSPTNDESDVEDQEVDEKPTSNLNVADLLKKLQSSGALVKKPKQEYHCFTCNEDFLNWEELENHLIQHVSLPSVLLDKLPSDEEDNSPSGDENWSDEEDVPSPAKPSPKGTPQKLDISQILMKSGISIKKSGESDNKSELALDKLSGLGFTIKKNTTPIKKEPQSEEASNDLMQKLGQLGGIKLKLKSDGNNSNTFKVINGLKDFKASDEEDFSGNEDENDQDADSPNEGHDKSGEQDESAGENDSADDSDKSHNIKTAGALKSLQGRTITPKIESEKSPLKPLTIAKTPVKDVPKAIVNKQPPRPAVKQTPKRGSLPVGGKQIKELNNQQTDIASTPERRQSHDINMTNIVVKKEIDNGESQNSNMPLFPGQIKSERTSPPPLIENKTPIVIAKVKTEPDSTPANSQPLFSNTPLLRVAKTEDTGVTVIEINGDSNDEDDDCCVVSATPAPDVKPIVPKIENPTPPAYPTPAYSKSQPSYDSSSVLSSRLSSTILPSAEKQHCYDWHAPDTKPPLDMLEKSTDDIFESLLSSATKKENLSLSDASEYISLDTLGPQHSCDVCNTRFTNTSLLDEHKRITGHSSILVAHSPSTLLPYNPSSNILSSLLPVKQIADQVGKLSVISGTSAGFTHQQNVMINIQAYPGTAGVIVPTQGYASYPPGQNMPAGYSQHSNNMYGATGQQMQGQQMSGQFPAQSYMGQQAYPGQFPTPISKAGYPGAMSQNSFASAQSPYSNASPLQSMQQSVYAQAGLMTTQGQMGPPPSPSNPYAPASSPGGSMKPPTSTGVRIQNVQNFPPGQTIPGQNTSQGQDMNMGQMPAPAQVVGSQMPSPSQIRMASGANITGARPRMPGMRGQRPSIRPGIQVHGQVRGARPGVRMPMKRPAQHSGGPGQKRRTDMLLPGKHDNEDCQVMAMQKQREGLPLIQSVQGAKDKFNLGSQISITKKTVNKEANAMANVLASRGISVKQKQKSRSPSPERPIPHIPNLGAGVSIKHTSKSSNFSLPESKVGSTMQSCMVCKRMFMNNNSLAAHMSTAHPQVKVPIFKCEECPASYPKALQLQHHKRVFHNVSGPNRELGLPVVDLSQEDNLKRLSSLGIYSFIPLANREQGNGCFGIPVISVHNAQNGLTSSLQALGADGLLSLGPLKPLPNS